MLRRLLTLALTLFGSPALAATPHECLSEAIYFEAQARSAIGRAAVGHTIMNRVKSSEFPDTVCEVVTEGEEDGECQFSFRCDGLPETVIYPKKFERAQATAREILDGTGADPTDGALFFHSARIPPGWFGTLTRTGKFGGNIFYR